MRNLIRLVLLLGVDFEWLSTGCGEMRHPPHPVAESGGAGWVLPEDERDLLACYASLKALQRETLLAFLRTLTT